jgi:hypothetical protein
MAIVNATSNVLFLPHMANFHKTYLTAYFVGMSFSSLVPSGIKLIQGGFQSLINDFKWTIYLGVPNSVQCQMTNGSISYENSKSNPWFDVREYNLIMFGWLCLATISFAALHWFSPDSAKRRNSDERIKRSASKEKSLNKDDDDEITHSNDENETKAIRV